MPQDENKLVALYCHCCNTHTPQMEMTAGYCCQVCTQTNYSSESNMPANASNEWLIQFWRNRSSQFMFSIQGLPQGYFVEYKFPNPLVNGKTTSVQSLESAVAILCDQLKADPGLWQSYKSNIAMAFYDSYQEFYNHEQYADIVKPRKLKNSTILGIADDAAENFLNLLTNKTQ